MASLSLKALNRRRLIGRFVKKRLSKLSFLLYFVALVWLLVIPDDRHSHRTYFSENALLPGQTTRYFSASDARRVTRLSEELSRLENSGSEERARFVKEELHSCGLKSDTQKFETRSPASKKNISGVNAYGIVTAPRADGTEAMVLSATWTSRDRVHPNYDGVAAVITLGCFFRQYSFWSKDIVVLVADRQETGAQAWIETYHGSQSNAFQMVEPLQLRSGAIQAAINLDFKGAGRYKSLGIFLEGVNGHLPNLDLVNTVDWISRTEGTQISLHDNQAYSPFLGYGEAVDQYVTSLTAVTRMMLHQASGYPTGTHGVFHRYKIDALTIYGIPADDAQQYAVGFDRIGRIIESTFRSINHLIEHLHQSFFLYLLSSLQRYISIGLYIPPVILMIVSFILKSVSLWWNTAHTCPHPKTRTDPSADKNDIQSATGKEGEITPEGYIVAAPAYSLTDARVLASPAVTILLAYACGLAIFMISKSDFGARSGGPKMAFYFTLGLATWVHVVAVLVVIPQARKWIHDYLFGTTANHVSSPCQDSCTAEWQTLKAASLGIVAMTVSGIAPLNYSLSVLISVMVGIPYLCVTRTRNIFLWMAQGLVISGLSPPVLGMIAAKLTGTDGAGMAEVWGRLTDGYDIMGIWILPFICLIYWPSNIMFSSLLHQQS